MFESFLVVLCFIFSRGGEVGKQIWGDFFPPHGTNMVGVGGVGRVKKG